MIIQVAMPISLHTALSIRVPGELLNILNRHHFANPNTGLGNTSNCGYVTGVTGSPRNIQLGLRLGW